MSKNNIIHINEVRKTVIEQLLKEERGNFNKIIKETKSEILKENGVEQVAIVPKNPFTVVGFKEGVDIMVTPTEGSRAVIEVTTSVFGPTTPALEKQIAENIKPVINESGIQKNVKIIGKLQNWGTEKFGKEFNIVQKVKIMMPKGIKVNYQ